MHNTKLTSNMGQLRGCTIFGARNSISTETAILTDSHNMKLTALTPGDMLLIRLLMPRAIKAPGTTTTAAPYSAEFNTTRSPVTAQDNKATTAPTAACAATTHQAGT